jgi:DNA-binding response OmpR family regulator
MGRFSKRPPVILVVDDDLQVQRAMEIMLGHSGYRVLLAGSGQEAIDRVASSRPDLMLLDVMMPEMDGYETTRRIRELAGGDQLPIIFLSVLGGEAESKARGLALGICDCIAKPVKMQDLRRRIEACLAPDVPSE